MEWYLDSNNDGGVRDLRHEFADYLRRHAESGSDLEAAELAFSELITNASVHAQSAIWVSVDWQDESPTLTVHDLGPGFELDLKLPDDPFALGGRGLYMVSHLAGQLKVASKKAGGSAVSLVLPVRRALTKDFDPPRGRHESLPATDEASDDGTFDKESFLRALVVQVAQTIEAQGGPDAAESAIAQVGTDVGGRMEDAYRRAHDLVGSLSVEQMGDLFVRLKHAIDGDFYVVDANEERIVLGNRRCPFGDAVRRAPALCRMTSSVFGGVAARNRGVGAVQLEERIAVGDPECRVIVWLRDPPTGVRPFAHLYTANG